MTLLVGHLGFKKTYRKLRERFFWPTMYADCDFWCKSCVDCSTRKTSKSLAKAPLLPIPSSYPFETVAVDVLGPFPTSLNGNRFIIVFTDTSHVGPKHLLSNLQIKKLRLSY